MRDRDEADVVAIEHLDDLGKVAKRAGEPVDLVDHNRVDLARLDVGEEPLERRTLEGATRDAPVIVHLRQREPALVLLAEDVRLAGLALCVERVEILLER